ncbi:aldo/keto reductase [Streptomyces sp. NPDC050804]|uniref:aldo/keto reductase n=1 Tax=Streptomyces sp. NPDC050804 TaxID=3154745 RepID=UPI00344679CA
MKTIELGSDGLRVPPQGFGAMGMSAFYGARDEKEAVATLNRAVDLGVTHIDTAEAYGPFENEKLIARALGGRRAEITIATKFARDFDADGTPLDGRAEHVRRAVERSLRHLETDTIDLYYLHRVDPAVPIEETVGAMSELVEAGKVRHLGLSEAAAATIRRAHAVHPITAVQSELSLFSRDLLENGIKAALDELGIGLVAFSPLGRGFLSGAIRSVDDLDPDDARRGLPRFSAESIAANLALVDRVGAVAEARGATPGQIALAWVAAQGAVSIPGTKRRAYLEENVRAADITLTPAELTALDGAVPTGAVTGARDTAEGLALTNR